MPELGLYVHVPFCVARCRYCDFYSTTALERIPAYLAALETELALRAPADARWATVYVGGGTPSVLGAEALLRLLSAVAAGGRLPAGAEVTVEVNPATVDRAALRALRAGGFNRVSIGVQSFDARDLAFLGRPHDGAAARAAVEDAQAAGFEQVSVDLIHGLPGRGLAHWRRQLRAAAELAPTHVSCYALTVAPGTPLGRLLAAGALRLPGEEPARRLFLATEQILAALGFERYEVSNHARGAAARCRHNLRYWRREAVLGVGPAAHSYDGVTRAWNHADLAAWSAALADGLLPVAGSERPDARQRMLEHLMLALRTSDGVALVEFAREHGVDLAVRCVGTIAQLVEHGLATCGDSFLRLTRAGMAVADGIPAMFLL